MFSVQGAVRVGGSMRWDPWLEGIARRSRFERAPCDRVCLRRLSSTVTRRTHVVRGWGMCPGDVLWLLGPADGGMCVSYLALLLCDALPVPRGPLHPPARVCRGSAGGGVRGVSVLGSATVLAGVFSSSRSASPGEASASCSTTRYPAEHPRVSGAMVAVEGGACAVAVGGWRGSLRGGACSGPGPCRRRCSSTTACGRRHWRC